MTNARALSVGLTAMIAAALLSGLVIASLLAGFAASRLPMAVEHDRSGTVLVLVSLLVISKLLVLVAAVLAVGARREALRDEAAALQSMATMAQNIAFAAERRRGEEELRKAKEAAEQASRAKSQFLASMSHELRTPLNAVMMYSELLQEEAQDTGATQLIPDLRKIHAAGRHLMDLINDVLDLSKMEAGKMELDVEEFSIAEIIQDVTTTILPAVQKNHNQLVTECAAGLGTMRSDPTKVRQVLLNLLSNAAKFCEGGVITLRAARQVIDGHAWVVVEIADTGIGMTPEQQARLFQSFFQADAGASSRHGGTGLGLAISRRLCRLMRGEIDVVSEPSQGSTFTVRLPVEVSGGAEGSLLAPVGGADGAGGPSLSAGRCSPAELPSLRSS